MARLMKSPKSVCTQVASYKIRSLAVLHLINTLTVFVYEFILYYNLSSCEALAQCVKPFLCRYQTFFCPEFVGDQKQIWMGTVGIH